RRSAPSVSSRFPPHRHSLPSSFGFLLPRGSRRWRVRRVTTVYVAVEFPGGVSLAVNDNQVRGRLLDWFAGFFADGNRTVSAIIGPIVRNPSFERGKQDLGSVLLEHGLIVGQDSLLAFDDRVIRWHHDSVVGIGGGQACRVVGIERSGELGAKLVDRLHIR